VELTEHVIELYKEITTTISMTQDEPLNIFDLRTLRGSLMMLFTMKSFNLSSADQLRKFVAHELQRV